jgi:hypothetical protein
VESHINAFDANTDMPCIVTIRNTEFEGEPVTELDITQPGGHVDTLQMVRLDFDVALSLLKPGRAQFDRTDKQVKPCWPFTMDELAQVESKAGVGGVGLPEPGDVIAGIGESPVRAYATGGKVSPAVMASPPMQVGAHFNPVTGLMGKSSALDLITHDTSAGEELAALAAAPGVFLDAFADTDKLLEDIRAEAERYGFETATASGGGGDDDDGQDSPWLFGAPLLLVTQPAGEA